MIESRADLRRYIAADLDAHDLPSRWRPHYRVTQRQAYFQWLLRRSEYWTNCRRDPVGRVVAAVLRLRTKFLGERLGFHIPRNVFGPGLALVHPGTVVVNPDTQVGAYCRIHQDVTIGDSGGKLGDRVWIGPGAKVLQGVTVGDDAAIGANATVLHDVDAHTTVVGSPARPISTAGSQGKIHGAPRRAR